ncbi:MAG: hypothetical protein A2138_21195 [Deltaproteobacteria bacterium RBG_16_71_12]|nr:MAG: hypothetical protein A2138_21195 [Deltaproteobacteria bacterium RBG_16_71_12]
MRPDNGAGPLHRFTPVAVRWSGEAGSLSIRVMSAGHPAIGETIRGDRQAVFVPAAPYEPNGAVTWTVRACGKKLTGSFAVGALTHPLADLDENLGTRPFDIDLRSATWESPTPRDPFGELLLKWQLAPVFLVQFVRLDDGSAVVALAPGVTAEDGTVRQDLSRPLQVANVSLRDNPYVTLTPDQLELALGTSSVVMTDVELVLGLTPSGLDDGRLLAEVRVPGKAPAGPPDPRPVPGRPTIDFKEDPRGALGAVLPPNDPCRALAALSNGSCHACPDGQGRCFTLVLSDIEGPTSKVRDLIALPLGPVTLPTNIVDNGAPRTPIGPIEPPSNQGP